MFVTVVVGSNDINLELFFLTEEHTVHFSAKVELLAIGFVPDPAIADDSVKSQLTDHLGDLVVVDSHVFDLFLHIFFIVCKVFVFVSLYLDIGLLLQQVQRFLDCRFMGCLIHFQMVD
ncbi:MAG: hypothetical protein EOM17_10870 [Synergistales bacterium]|nr:hypothetical protein [Synergistales bacterium]